MHKGVSWLLPCVLHVAFFAASYFSALSIIFQAHLLLHSSKVYIGIISDRHHLLKAVHIDVGNISQLYHRQEGWAFQRMIAEKYGRVASVTEMFGVCRYNSIRWCS